MVIEPWTPSLVPGAFWQEAYDNNDFSFSSGSNIATWPNKYNPSQTFLPVGAGAPIFNASERMVSCNGSNSLRHGRGFGSGDGDQGQGLATYAGLNTYYLYSLFVFRTSFQNASTPHLHIGGFNISGPTAILFHVTGGSNNQLWIRTNSQGSKPYLFSGFELNAWMMWEVFYDLRPHSGQGGTNTIRVAKNGGTFQTYVTSTDGGMSNFLQGNIGFGSNNSSSYIPIDVKCLYLAQLDVTDPDSYKQIEKIRGYFAHRLNLTSLLPNDHIHKSAPPLISSYNSIVNLEQNLFPVPSRLSIQEAGKVTVADTDKVIALRSDGVLYSATPGTPLDLTASGAARPTYNAANKYIEFNSNQTLKALTMKTLVNQGTTVGLIAVIQVLSYASSNYPFAYVKRDIDSMSFVTWALALTSPTKFRCYSTFYFSEFTIPANILENKCIISCYAENYRAFAPAGSKFRINGIEQPRTTTPSNSSAALSNSSVYHYCIGNESSAGNFRLYDFLWVDTTDKRAIEKYEYQLALDNNIRSSLDNSHLYKTSVPKF
jgi:hypothetical protein